MGYLLAVTWKRNALRRRQDAQGSLHTITTRLHLAKKQSELMLKSLEYQARTMKNNAQVQANAATTELYNQLITPWAEAYGIDPNDIAGGLQGLDEETRKQAQEQLTAIQQQVSAKTTQITQQLSNYNLQVEQWLENAKTMQYEPLKQEDELLEQEKVDAEDELKIAEDEYNQVKSLADKEVKNIVPQFGQ